MAFLAPVLGGLGALAGGLFGAKPQKQATEQTTTNTSNANFNSSVTPNLDPFALQARDQAFRNLARMNQDPSLSGYTSEGLQNINNSQQARTMALNNILTSRGLGSSPIAASALGSQESNRISQQNQFLNTIPLLRQELQRRNATDYTNFFRSLPIGQTTSGTSFSDGSSHTVGNGSITAPGGIAGNAIGSASSILAGLYGAGAFRTNPNKPSNSGGDEGWLGSSSGGGSGQEW